MQIHDMARLAQACDAWIAPLRAAASPLLHFLPPATAPCPTRQLASAGAHNLHRLSTSAMPDDRSGPPQHTAPRLPHTTSQTRHRPAHQETYDAHHPSTRALAPPTSLRTSTCTSCAACAACTGCTGCTLAAPPACPSHKGVNPGVVLRGHLLACAQAAGAHHLASAGAAGAGRPVGRLHASADAVAAGQVARALAVQAAVLLLLLDVAHLRSAVQCRGSVSTHG
jgi:hypothetical protein